MAHGVATCADTGARGSRTWHLCCIEAAEDGMKIRKEQGPDKLVRDELGRRFLELFDDPAFGAEQEALARIEGIGWAAYQDSRKAPIKREAGAGCADPSYELSVEWLETRERLQLASYEPYATSHDALERTKRDTKKHATSRVRSPPR